MPTVDFWSKEVLGGRSGRVSIVVQLPENPELYFPQQSVVYNRSDGKFYQLSGAGWAAISVEAGHSHTLADVTDSGTAAALNVPATGDAAVGEVVKGDDTRLTNARTPTTHAIGGSEHSASTLAALNAKVSDANLDAAGTARPPTAHSHTLSDVTDSGGAAALNVGTAAGTVAAGDDSRITGAVQGAREVATQHSLDGGGDLTTDRTLSLVNDAATPGSSKYYGTDGAGARGYHDLPAGGGDSHVPDPALETDGRSLEVSSGALVYAAETSKVGHSHTLTDVTDSGTAAALNVPAAGDAAVGEVVKGNDSRLSDARAPTSHDHPLSEITDSGTAAALDVPATGDAAAGQVVKGDDTRLADARTPTAHNHTLTDITDSGTAAALNVPAAGDAAVGEVVKGDDSRLSDDRSPMAHAHTLTDITDSGGAAALNVGTTAGTVAAGDDARLNRVPDPSGEADDRILKTLGGEFVYGDEAGGGLSEPATFTQEATFEHQITTPPVALGTSGVINLDFAGRAFRTINVAGGITFTTSNLAAGRGVLVKLLGDFIERTVVFPADWKFVSDKPSSVLADSVCVLYLLSETSANSGVIASWSQDRRVPLDAREMNFQEDGTIIVPITHAERLDLGNVTHFEIDGTAGTGTLSFKKDNGADLALWAADFAAGEVLAVTLTGSTTPSAVAIPRTTQ